MSASQPADAAADVDSMSIKSLRSLITAAGLSFSDCVEKSELRARAREAQAVLSAAPAPSSGGAEGGGSLDQCDLEWGNYSCCVKKPAGDEPVSLVVVMLHGFGASNTDFIDHVPALCAAAPGLCEARVGYVFPQAPSGGMGLPAWWHLDPMQWLMAAQNPAGVAQLIREEPQGLTECRARVASLLDAASDYFGVPHGKIVLSGFSQGAMTAMDAALNQPADKRVAGVTMVSGAPIVVDQWAARLGADHRGIKVAITHGRSDMVLPFAASGWSRELLESGGADVTYHAHGGGHELGDSAAIGAITGFWASLL